jgi:hypothetical protein
MNVVIKKIDEPSTKNLGAETRQSEFLVDFDSEACSGKAVLHILHSSVSIDMTVIRNRFLGIALKVNVGVESIIDFKQLPGPGREQVIPLGPRGEFAFEGFISRHLISGEGSVFQSDGVEMILTAKMIPKTFDILEEGAWVSFQARGLSFWLW